MHALRGWNIPFPSFNDTLLSSDVPFRQSLSRSGFGFVAYNLSVFAVDALNSHSSYRGAQIYWGQRPSFLNSTVAFLTSDWPASLLADGQLQVSVAANYSTWQPYAKNAISLNGLALYHTAFDRRVEMKLGYVANSMEFVGTFIGGNLASPFGVSASIPYELGMSLTGQPAPTIRAKINLSQNSYWQSAVQRSLSPTAASVFDAVSANPTGFRLRVSGWDALYLNELGYRVRPTSNARSAWLRAGALYNNSRYYNYSDMGYDRNHALYALADLQMLQRDPIAAPAQGVYLGVSAMSAPSALNVFSRNFEFRGYAIGMSDRRPADMISVVVNRNEISGHIAAATNATSHLTGRRAHTDARTITASYTAKIRPGVSGTVGIAHTDHPSINHFGKSREALNVLSSLYVAY